MYDNINFTFSDEDAAVYAKFKNEIKQATKEAFRKKLAEFKKKEI